MAAGIIFLALLATASTEPVAFGTRGIQPEIQLSRSSSAMDISEKRTCYVYGQCQEYSVDFQYSEDPEHCHTFCAKNSECNWWSYEGELNLCKAFQNCTLLGEPAQGPCPTCISGEDRCPARDCH